MHRNHVYISQKEATDIVDERQTSDATMCVLDTSTAAYDMRGMPVHGVQ